MKESADRVACMQQLAFFFSVTVRNVKVSNVLLLSQQDSTPSLNALGLRAPLLR
jgi:hypothetical protein